MTDLPHNDPDVIIPTHVFASSVAVRRWIAHGYPGDVSTLRYYESLDHLSDAEFEAHIRRDDAP